MVFPTRGVEIIDAFLERAEYRMLAQGSEDDRRTLTRRIAQQLRFELGPGWGTKKAGEGNPQSKDAVAFSQPPALVCWDWQNGTTRARQVQAGELATDIHDQFFIDVEPINVLSIPSSEPVPTTPVPDGWEPIALQLDGLRRDIVELRNELNATTTTINQIKARQDNVLQGSAFGFSIVLRRQDRN